MTINQLLNQVIQSQPYPLLFATISGAHLYGFPSADSDYDLRGVHLLPLEKLKVKFASEKLDILWLKKEKVGLKARKK